MIIKRLPTNWVYFCLLSALTILALLSLTSGAMPISVSDSLKGVIPGLGALPDHIELIIQDIRLPRTILCLSVGGILSLSGAMMQTLFRNPLAEPGIVGVSGGAALGAALTMLYYAKAPEFNPNFVLFGPVPFFAFVGATLTTLLVYRIGRTPYGHSVPVMLLAGIAVSALSGAILGVTHYMADDQTLRDITMWSMGSLASADWDSVILATVALLVISALSFRWQQSLNTFLLGEGDAEYAGVRVGSLKKGVILTVAAGVGVAVSLCGIIGFVGLVIPHISRMLCGPDHRVLLPVSAIGGATILLAADILARTLVAPAEMPVGIITALLGGPFFVWLLIQQKGRIL